MDRTFASAVRLAAAIRSRQMSAVELVRACLERIAASHAKLNAVVTLDARGALERAQAADAALSRGETWGTLHGVPITVKDSIEVAGLRATASYPPLADHVAVDDATAVARLRAAGAIVLGKTNLPALTRDFQTDSPLFGRTNNPWDPTRTPGGSSGGGAAAVAAGLTALDVGSDYTGSLRVPAHFCGLLTLKPTEHRVPSTGQVGLRPARHMNTLGPLARSVADLQMFLSLCAGPDGRDTDVAPVPVAPAPRRVVGDLRLLMVTDLPGAPLGAESRTAMQQLAARLEGWGASVEHAHSPGFDAEAAREVWGVIAASELSPSRTAADDALVRARLAESERYPDIAVLRGLARAYQGGLGEYDEALRTRVELIRALEATLSGWDALVVPVTAVPAFTHRVQRDEIELGGGESMPYWHLGSHCSPFSVTGSPVVVLPVGTGASGLPIGVQLIGRRWRDEALLSVAEALEVAGLCFVPPAAAARQTGA
jgi:amidase